MCALGCAAPGALRLPLPPTPIGPPPPRRRPSTDRAPGPQAADGAARGSARSRRVFTGRESARARTRGRVPRVGGGAGGGCGGERRGGAGPAEGASSAAARAGGFVVARPLARSSPPLVGCGPLAASAASAASTPARGQGPSPRLLPRLGALGRAATPGRRPKGCTRAAVGLDAARVSGPLLLLVWGGPRGCRRAQGRSRLELKGIESEEPRHGPRGPIGAPGRGSSGWSRWRSVLDRVRVGKGAARG